jgi:hypothetical protein
MTRTPQSASTGFQMNERVTKRTKLAERSPLHVVADLVAHGNGQVRRTWPMLLSRNCGRRGRQRKLGRVVAADVLFNRPGFGGPRVDDRLARCFVMWNCSRTWIPRPVHRPRLRPSAATCRRGTNRYGASHSQFWLLTQNKTGHSGRFNNSSTRNAL